MWKKLLQIFLKKIVLEHMMLFQRLVKNLTERYLSMYIMIVQASGGSVNRFRFWLIGNQTENWVCEQVHFSIFPRNFWSISDNFSKFRSAKNCLKWPEIGENGKKEHTKFAFNPFYSFGGYQNRKKIRLTGAIHH